MSTKVDINYVKWLKEELRKINQLKFDTIRWTKDGKVVEFDPVLLEQFDYFGMNNTDFITMGFCGSDI